MASVGILDQLEHDIGKPVISSNSANIWGSFKPLGIKVGPGFGRLLASL
jgi:maleate cis-trans isomerase